MQVFDHTIYWSVNLPGRTSYALTIGSDYMAERITKDTHHMVLLEMLILQHKAQKLEDLAVQKLRSGGATWTPPDLSTCNISISYNYQSALNSSGAPEPREV